MSEHEGDRAGGGGMNGVEGSREEQRQYVVLSRACADLYEEMVALFSDWPGIEVVVDRRHEPRSSRGFLAPIGLYAAEGRSAPSQV
jgi:hypothetical protein